MSENVEVKPVDAFVLKDLWIQIFATLLGTLIAISNGMVYGWTSPMIPYLMSNQSHIPITQTEGEWFETLLFIGSATGLPGTVFVVDFFGRKGSMIISAVMGCICWMMILWAPNLGVIYASRFFSGMAGNMCFISAPMYIAEIADSRIRGFLGAFSYLMMLTGIITVYTVGAHLPYYAAPTIGIVLTLCEAIFFPFMPETPYYYLYKNDEARARDALCRLRSDHTKIDAELREIKKAIERQKLERGRPQDLFLIPSNRYAMLLTLLLNALQHFIGISVMLMNMHLILEEAGSVYMRPSIAAICFAVIMLIGATLASVIIDRFGRKFLLIISAVLTGVSLLVLAIYFQLKNSGYDLVSISWIPLICVLSYAGTFKIGLGIVPIVLSGEIFPSRVKALGMTLADFFYVMAATASITIFTSLYEACGIHAPFYMFSFCSFLAIVLVYFFVPETKGKTLEQIQIMLKGDKYEHNVAGEEMNSLNTVA